MAPRLTIAVCVYDRHDLLKACVDSIAALPLTVEAEAIIVDNSDTDVGSPAARAIVEAAAERSALPMRYLHARGPNISVARNAAIDATSGDYLGFVDDDMALPASWPAEVVAAMDGSGADIMLGLVRAVLMEGGTVENAAAYFDRTLPLADRSVVQPTLYGHYRGARTSNAVFRRATTFDRGFRFDLAFGRTGGEDTELFTALHRVRPKVIYSTAAWASETIPASRQTPTYLHRRALRGSQLFVRSMVKHSHYGAATGAYHRLVGMAQWMVAAARDIGGSKTGTLANELARSSALGKIRWAQDDTATHYS